VGGFVGRTAAFSSPCLWLISYQLKRDMVKFMLYMFLKLTVITLAVPVCVDTELAICCIWLAFWRTEFYILVSEVSQTQIATMQTINKTCKACINAALHQFLIILNLHSVNLLKQQLPKPFPTLPPPTYRRL